jgi:hypothetical protein
MSCPLLVELSDHVGADVGRGCEDTEEVAAGSGGQLGERVREIVHSSPSVGIPANWQVGFWPARPRYAEMRSHSIPRLSRLSTLRQLDPRLLDHSSAPRVFEDTAARDVRLRARPRFSD